MGWYGPAPRQEPMQTTPWKVHTPRVTGMSLFEVIADVVDHNITALENITREHWAHSTADCQTKDRAQQFISDLTGHGIGPKAHNMEPLVHLLMADPGPKEGTYVCSETTEDQVRDA